jgi:hypothetical protein
MNSNLIYRRVAEHLDKKFSMYIFIVAICTLFISSTKLFSQEVNEADPKTFKYFKILASTDDDSVFVRIQDEMSIDPKVSAYILIVNITDQNPENHYVVFGEETDATAIRTSWSAISKPVQQKLLNWSGPNKSNLALTKLNYISVFTKVLKNIRFKDVISPPKLEREILSTTAYINPYLNAFGADPLGIPLKKSFGFSFHLGTPYSGPFETDIVGANFHLLGAKIGVTKRIKELGRKHETSPPDGMTDNIFFKYNNVYGPGLGLQASYVIPFGNFLEIGYYGTIDTGDYDPPMRIRNLAADSLSNRLMKSNFLANKTFFNWEFRYPLRTFGSTRAKIYIAQYMGEFHLGYIGRELRAAGSVFDLRMDYTFSSTKRNWQFIWEAYVANIGESFGFTSFAMGPSIRLTKGPNGSTTIVAAMINGRFKLGDFYSEK